MLRAAWPEAPRGWGLGGLVDRREGRAGAAELPAAPPRSAASGARAVPPGPRPRPHCAPRPPAALCFALTRSLLLTCLVPAGLLGLRYYYSRKVVLAYLDCALHTDMADIEQYYMKPPGECRALRPSSPRPGVRPRRGHR